MELTGLYASCACFSLNKNFALTGISLREQPFLYEMNRAPVNFLLALDFLFFLTPFMILRICAIVTEQSHVLNCRMFCILISN